MKARWAGRPGQPGQGPARPPRCPHCRKRHPVIQPIHPFPARMAQCIVFDAFERLAPRRKA